MSDARFSIEFGISRLIRYCSKRLRFFDGLHRTVLFVNTVAGASAFVTLLGDNTTLALWFSAAVAIGSALDNVIGFAERARRYSTLRTRYYELLAEVVSDDGAAFDEGAARAKRLKIDADCPPRRRVLDVICRNEEDMFRGYPEGDTIYISRFRYALRHLIDLPPRRWLTISLVKANKAGVPGT